MTTEVMAKSAGVVGATAAAADEGLRTGDGLIEWKKMLDSVASSPHTVAGRNCQPEHLHHSATVNTADIVFAMHIRVRMSEHFR